MFLFHILSLPPFAKMFAKQFRCPHGILGRYTATVMRKYNLEQTKCTVDTLELHPADNVLEIGFGTGEGLALVAEKVVYGTIAGIDISKDMIRVASAQNAEHIASRRIKLHFGNAEQMPFDDGIFNKVFAVNVLYFWRKPIDVLVEVLRVLRPGGTLVLNFASKHDAMNNPIAAQEDIFTRYGAAEEVYPLLIKAGFIHLHHRVHTDAIGTNFSITAQKAV